MPKYEPYVAPTGEGGWWWSYDLGQPIWKQPRKEHLPWPVYKHLRGSPRYPKNNCYARYDSRSEALEDLERAICISQGLECTLVDEPYIVEGAKDANIRFDSEGGFTLNSGR